MLTCVVIAFPWDLTESQKNGFHSSGTCSVVSMVPTSKVHMCSLVNAMEVFQVDLERLWGILSRKNSSVPVPKLWYHNLLSLFLIFFILFLGMWKVPKFSKIWKMPSQQATMPPKYATDRIWCILWPHKYWIQKLFSMIFYQWCQKYAGRTSDGIRYAFLSTFHFWGLCTYAPAVSFGLGIKLE